MKFLILSVFLFQLSFAQINLIKKENSDSNTTLLVIGGIHGDEPGGYFAASILASHYDITSKNVWIVPNINSDSITANRRGIHGDMNRKFAQTDPHDKDKNIIKEIKKIILEKKVSLILNLHDGHGFYREKHQGIVFNPNAWGQTCVIDQCSLNLNQEFADLSEIASSVKDSLNTKLLKEHHSFNVKNTKTKFEDEAMQLSLTYFAVTHNKPAFAIESSKNLSSLSQKVFYQLLAIEEFMKIMKIDFKRNFKFSEMQISKIIQEYGTLTINSNITIDLSNIKKHLSYIPLKSRSNEFNFTHPLGKVKESNGQYLVYIGNQLVTTLKPQEFKMSATCSINYAIVDKKQVFMQKASNFFVNDDFTVLDNRDLRVNIIGYSKKGVSDESNVSIKVEDLNKKYSLDRSNKVYRVEFYKNDEFCFMSTVHFR